MAFLEAATASQELVFRAAVAHDKFKAFGKSLEFISAHLFEDGSLRRHGEVERTLPLRK